MGVVSQALEKRRTRVAEQVAVKHAATQDPFGLTAAAASIPLDGTGWQTFKLGDQKWQKDAWHHYDINGDMRFLANWVGKACSRARLYLAKVDENGRPGEEVDDPKLQIIAETMFGSPASKAEAQRLMGVHLFVPGESFIVAEAADNANEDRWYVVSTSDIRRQGQTQVEVRRPQQYGGGWYTLKPGTDLLIRCWTPHPRAYDQADSSVRTGLIPLREIEQLTKFEFAEIDSRLAGAGILLVPQEMDFPRAPGQKADAASLAAQLTKTMAAALASREDPASLVPIVIQVPGDLVDKVKHLSFANLLSGELKDRMEGAVNRLARCLETEPEILTGKADMNHWSSWQVDESTINIHVAPLLSRMCDALTAGYVRAALQVLGEDPDAYVLWYDTAMLTVEPDRQADGMEMWDKGLISDDAARKAGSWGEGDEPDDEEFQRRFAEKMVGLDPSKIEWPDVRKAIGRGVENWTPPAAPAEGADQANAPAGAATADKPGGGAPNPDNVRQLPTAAQRQQPPDRQDSRQAAALRVGAHMAVQRALELAGKRLLTRANRDRYQDVPAHELHTRIRVGDPTRVDALLASGNGPAVDLSVLAEAAEIDEQDLANLLGAYCSELMVRGIRHNADLLNHYLAAGLHAGCTPQGCAAPDHPGRCDEEVRAFHLPGRHNQQTHGHRQHGGTGKPFTEHQNLVRRAMRNQGKDPDKEASAKSRQGRRAWSDWEIHAEGLSKEAAKQQAMINAKLEEDLRKAEKEAEERKAKRSQAAELAENRQKLEDEWRDIESKMWEGMDPFKGLSWEQSSMLTYEERKEIYERAQAKMRARVEAARKRFFAKAGNPPAVTGNQPVGWEHQLTSDTGFADGAGVPAEDVTVSDYLVKKGWVFRQDGVSYMIEDTPEHNDFLKDPDIRRGLAAVKARQMHDIADRTLLPGWTDTVDSIAWIRGQSPGNDYWRKRFNNPNHTAAASAGHGEITYWGRDIDGIQNSYRSSMPNADPGTVETLRHEFGHLVDKHQFVDGEVQRFSQSPEWQGATRRDSYGNYDQLGDTHAANVLNFAEINPHHPIVLEEGPSTKEQPNGVTTYGRSSPAEDFAESFYLYTKGVVGTGNVKLKSGRAGPVRNVYFRDLFPHRAAVLDKMFPKFARQQKAEIKKLGASA